MSVLSDFIICAILIDLLDYLLLQKHCSVRKEAAKQSQVFQSFTDSLKPENIKHWTAEVVAFEQDPTAPDSYETGKTGEYTSYTFFLLSLMSYIGLSEADICRQLVEEANQAIEDGEPSLHEVDPYMMLITLLDIEEQQ